MKKIWKGIKGIFSFIKKEFKAIAAVTITVAIFVFIMIVKNMISDRSEKEKKVLIEKLEKAKKDIENKLKQKKETIKKDEKIVNDYGNDLNDLADGKLPD